MDNINKKVFDFKNNKKKRIAFIIGSLNIGGTERHLLNLINRLDPTKYDIDIHLLNEKGILFEELNSSVKKFYPKKIIYKKIDHFFNFFRTLWRIKATKPDVIHCFLPQSYIFGGVIGLILNHKNIIMSRRSLNFYQNNFKFFPFKKLESFLHKRTRLILANSIAVKKQLINEEHVDEKKCRLIYNGIIKPTKTNYKVNILKRKLGIVSSDFVFSSIANFIPYKNHLLIIKAAKKLMSVTKNFKILFVGGGEKEYVDFLKKEVLKHYLDKNIFFQKQSREDVKFFLISDVGISSSKEEGLSNTILEFLYFGKPVIATNVGGNPELVNKSNGFLIDSNSHEQMFNAMKSIIGNKKRYQRLKRGAKNKSMSFDFTSMVKKYEEIYDKII